jgi:plasmid stability protein
LTKNSKYQHNDIILKAKEFAMSTMTVRELPDDLQAFLKADAAANQRSVNKQVIVALQAYRDAKLAQVPYAATPAKKIAAMNIIRANIQREMVHDPRTDDEITGYNEHGHFD